MKPYHILLPFLSFITLSYATTQYVGDNVTITVESVQPCHLFGDADLYGRGVRYSFYITFAAGIVGILLGANREFKAPRLSFNILLLTLLIVLIRNATRGSYALLEWYIVMGLAILTLNVFLMTMPRDFFSLDEITKDDKTKDSPPPPTDLAEGGQAGPSEGLQDIHARPNKEEPPAIPKTTREQKEDRRQKDAEERAERTLTPFLAGYYSDPIGYGFLILIYSALACFLPYLYFVIPDSGHKEGCPVPVVLFGTWDMYNVHWRRFQKASAVMGVVFTLILFPVALFMIFNGVKKWKTYDKTLDVIKERGEKGLKLLRVQVPEMQKVLEAGRRMNLTELEDAERSGAVLRLGNLIQYARTREEAASMTEEQLLQLLSDVNEALDKRRIWRVVGLFIRGLVGVSAAVGGGLSIWFIERTIDRNGIDMDDRILSNNGQMLALIVAALTTGNFIWELLKSWKDRHEVRREAEEIAHHIRLAALDMHAKASDQKAWAQRLGDRLRNVLSWMPAAAAAAPSAQPATATQQQRGGRGFGSWFSHSPQSDNRDGDNAV